MITFLTILHVSVIVLMVLVILVQSGKGAEISASFGGSSQSVFGSSGGANFFTKLTAGLATTFMITSILLTIVGTKSKKSVFEGVSTAPATQTTPATTPATPATTPTTPEKK